MANEIKINENVKTKVCKCCGRELPLSEFTLMYGKNYTNTCKECVNEKQRDSRKKSNYKKGLQQYLADDSMHIKRQYKEINGNRILRKKVSGIEHCTRDKTYEEALEFVTVRQIEKIESVAEKCKGTIPMCAYEAMMNWDVRLAMCG